MLKNKLLEMFLISVGQGKIFIHEFENCLFNEYIIMVYLHHFLYNIS